MEGSSFWSQTVRGKEMRNDCWMNTAVPDSMKELCSKAGRCDGKNEMKGEKRKNKSFTTLTMKHPVE